jgi:hypothetical protein
MCVCALFSLGGGEGGGGSQMCLRLLLIVEASHKVLFTPLSGAIEIFHQIGKKSRFITCLDVFS